MSGLAASGAVTAHPRGSQLAVTVAPRSSVNRIDRLDESSLRVRVTAAPVDGAANTALLRVLSAALDIPRSRLEISSGESSRRKRILVAGIAPDELTRRVDAALAAGA